MASRDDGPEVAFGHDGPEVGPEMTESPSTGSGGRQSSVLCPDGPLVYRENLRPHNAVI